MKIVSVGVAASDWVTYHGIAINIAPELSFFKLIYPCGMKNIEVTSLKDLLSKDIIMADAKDRFLARFAETFLEDTFRRQNA